MYFGLERTREYCRAVAELASRHPAVVSGAIELFVIPSTPFLTEARLALGDTPVRLGAQNLHWADEGAFTGEVGGPQLVEVGAELVEVGHAERRRLFGETEEVVALKSAAALRAGLVPVVCVGEPERATPDAAAAVVGRQVRSALADAGPGRVIVAYEPVWAIGAAEPAEAGHVRAVSTHVSTLLGGLPGRTGSTVVYGGSAGPGLLGELFPHVGGLFLGRFAHDPSGLHRVLDDAADCLRIPR